MGVPLFFRTPLVTLDVINALRYYELMIKSFKCVETERIFGRHFSRKLPQGIQKIAQRRLWYLHAAKDLKDLQVPPGNRLERLGGDRQGQHSIRINEQWRICFEWHEGNAYNVGIVDYH